MIKELASEGLGALVVEERDLFVMMHECVGHVLILINNNQSCFVERLAPLLTLLFIFQLDINLESIF